MSSKPKTDKQQQNGKKKPRANRKSVVNSAQLKKRMDSAALGKTQRTMRKVRPDYRAAATQFVDPASSNGVLIPDRTLNARAVRRFQKIITIKATDPGCANGFTFVAQPSLAVPAMYTGGANVLPVAGLGPIQGIGYMNFNKNLSLASDEMKFQDATDRVALVKTSSIVHTDAHPAWYLKNAATADSNSLSLTVDLAHDNGDSNFKYSILRAATGDPTWTVVASLTVAPKGKVTYGLGNLNFDNLAIVAVDSGGKDHKLAISFSSLSTGTSQVSTVATVDMGNGNIIQELESAQGGRLVGMSVLATNASAPLSRGGEIYAGRLPRDITPFDDHTKLSNMIPANRLHVGTADTGSYTWWFPDDFDETTYDTLVNAKHRLADSNYLYCKVVGWGADSVFKVTVTYVVEFYIENALYEKIQPPMTTPEWDTIFAMLPLLPAASCNPAHELFKGIVNKAAGAAHGVAQHYSNNKALYDMLLTALLAVTA